MELWEGIMVKRMEDSGEGLVPNLKRPQRTLALYMIIQQVSHL